MKYVVYRCVACGTKTPDPFEGPPLRECECGSATLEYHQIQGDGRRV